jgi:hypothetical protein
MNKCIRFKTLLWLFAGYVLCSCNREKIILDKVRYLPDYMFIKNHFGTDLKSMEERNEFILVTGTIDTTTELPPADVAVIIINKQEQVLHRNKSTVTNNGFSEQYSGNGYTVSLYYTKSNKYLFTAYEGKLMISKGLSATEYEIIGVDGYH